MGDPSLLLTDFTLYKVSLARNPRANVCIVAAVCIWNCNPQSSFSWCLQMRGMWQSADLAYLEEARHWAPSPLTKARYPAEGGDWKGKERVWFLLSTCLFLAKAPVTQIDGCVSHVGPICLPAVQLWLNPLKKLWPTDQLSAGNGCVQCENSGAAAFREDNGSPLILPSYKGEETISLNGDVGSEATFLFWEWLRNWLCCWLKPSLWLRTSSPRTFSFAFGVSARTKILKLFWFTGRECWLARGWG